jgi:hypothetical protein
VNKLNIEQVELQVSRDLRPFLKAALREVGYSVPDDHRLCISLVDGSGRKKRSSAKADNWSPDSGQLQIWFEPGDVGSDEVHMKGPTELLNGSAAEVSSARPPIEKTEAEPGMVALIKALARAENTPGWSFVSLKKFRDEILPAEGLNELRSPIDQRHFLGDAINNKLVVTSRVANPKDPRFPVTTIRLNRVLPAVQKILCEQPTKSLDFAPIHIKGEPLSATVLRERR